MCRRALVVVVLMVTFWAAPAAAQTIGDPVGDYPPTVVPTSLVLPTTLPPVPEVEEDDDVETADTGALARTGADNIGPLIQAGIVLLGAGTLLVLVARRRRAVRRAAAA